MDKFETWWEREGQEFLFALNTTTDDDIKLVAEVAWKNGAYCAEQADGEQWSPNDMAYRPSGLSMEQAEQEPVAWVDLEQWQSGEYDCFTSEKVADYMTPLYTAPVRTKDLTDDEIADALYGKRLLEAWVHPDHLREYRRVIQADREKNR